MSSRPVRRSPASTTPLACLLLVGLCAWGLVGGFVPMASFGVGSTMTHSPSSSIPGSHPAGSSRLSGSNAQGLCPSAGPTFLGIQWNCVAILNLTEVGLILAGIGIVAYVFKDSDEAELPGDAAEVPVTAEEEEEYRKSRSMGLPYRAPEAPPEEEER